MFNKLKYEKNSQRFLLNDTLKNRFLTHLHSTYFQPFGNVFFLSRMPFSSSIPGDKIEIYEKLMCGDEMANPDKFSYSGTKRF